MKWPTARLGDVVENLDSRRIPIRSSDRQAGPYPYYGASGVVDHVDGFLFEGPHLLIAEDGENLRSQNTPVAFMADGHFWVNNHAHVVRGLQGLADTRFICHQLQTVDFTPYLTGSAQPKLNRGSLDTIPLTLPDLPTQTAIAEVLGSLDDKIAANERIVRRTQDLAHCHFLSALQQARSDALLGDYLSLSYGRSLPAAQRSEGPYAVIGSGGPNGAHGNWLVSGPGVVLGRKGSIGSTWWSDESFWPIDTVFYVVPRERVSLRFTFELLRWLRLGELNSDSAVPGLNRDVALNQPVPAVDAGHIAQFDSRVTSILELQAAAERENRALAEMRDALLPALMSGELSAGEVAEASGL